MNQKVPEVITAYYDMKVAPITFDFCNFIIAAAAYAIAKGRPDFDLVVIADAFRNLTPREQAYTLVERKWRIWNLITEIVKIAPNIADFSLLQRPPASFKSNSYPPNFHPTGSNAIAYNKMPVIKLHSMGIDVRMFKASDYAKRAIDALIPNIGKKLIAITLRKSLIDSSRDSRLPDWIEFIKMLETRGYQVVIVPDQDDALGQRELNKYGWHVIDVASMSLDLRLAIYERAHMNYVTNGGMVDILVFTKAPFKWFSVIVEGHTMARAEYYTSMGMEYGSKYPWLDDNQEMLWIPDSLPNLVTSLDRIPQ